MTGIPLQQDADPADVKQIIKCGLVHAAGIMLPSEDKADEVAQHLVDFGLRHHPELQNAWYMPHRVGAGWLEQGRGKWIAGEALGEPPVGWSNPQSDEIDEMISMLTPAQRQALAERLGAADD